MDYNITKLPGSEVDLRVKITFSEFEPHLRRAASLVSEEIKIDGFRPGKAPYEIVAKNVGEMAIYEKAAHLVIEKFYPKIIIEIMEDKKIFTPVGNPEITVTKLAPGNDLEFKVKLAVLPDFDLPDYKSIAKKNIAGKKEIFVSEDEILKSLNWIADSRATFSLVDRPIKKGDFTEIDFEVRKDGVLIDGGSSKNHPLVVGENRFMPGFEDALVGMGKGEGKIFDLKTPEDYHETRLAGATLNFKVKVNSIQEKKLPELTDEFVKSLGSFASLEDFKKNLKEGIFFEKEKKEAERVRLAIIDEIASLSKIDLPRVLINAELDKMILELRRGVENMQIKWEDYLAQVKKKEDDLRKGWIQQAERRVKIALCLSKIAKIEKVEPSEEEVKQAADNFLTQYYSDEETEKNIDKSALNDYARGIARNEKVFEFLEKL